MAITFENFIFKTENSKHQSVVLENGSRILNCQPGDESGLHLLNYNHQTINQTGTHRVNYDDKGSVGNSSAHEDSSLYKRKV